VSKLIHRETEPVLYCDNTFYVDAGRSKYKLVVSESWNTNWDPNPRRKITTCPVRVDMLLGLRQLTVRLDVSVSDERFSESDPHQWYHNHFALWARSAFANICLILSSASKLETLKITNIPPKGTLWSGDQLLGLVSPAVLLDESVTVSLEGERPALQNALDDLRRETRLRPDRTLSDCGTLLSRAMHARGNALYKVGEEVDVLYDEVKDVIISMRRALYLVLMTGSMVDNTGIKDGLKANLQVLESRLAMADAGLAVGVEETRREKYRSLRYY
jgi:hypothetical protein